MNAIVIFLMIGVANWASHIMTCDTCRETLWRNVGLFMDGAVHIFGWPIHACEHVLSMLKLPRTGMTPEEVEKKAKESIDRFFAARMENAIGMRQEPGESDDDFHARIDKVLREHAKQKKENGK